MDISSEYKGHCLTCGNYKPSTNWSEIHSSKGFWCQKHGWCDPYDKCGSYCKGYQSENFLEACLKEYNKKKRYYIVTTVCDLCGLPKDNEYRSMFATICEEHLIGTIDGEQLLADYDVYGADISWLMERLAHYPDSSDMIHKIIEEDILPEFDKMVLDVKKGNIRHAILRYIVLTRKLMNRFDIRYEPIESKCGGQDYSPVHDTLLALKRSN